MIRVVVAGWRGAREDLHGEVVRDGLGVFDELIGHTREDSDDVLVVSGDSPNGGVDEIARQYADSAGWKWESRRDQRSERIPGSGTGNYRVMFRERDVDWLVFFPGPNDSDCREAIVWATRYDVPMIGFPLGVDTWGGRKS